MVANSPYSDALRDLCKAIDGNDPCLAQAAAARLDAICAPDIGRWTATGRQEVRKGFFGGAVLWVEVTRRIFYHVVAAHSPGNWREETKWRRARNEDVSWTSSIPRSALNIPMPPGVKPPREPCPVCGRR